MREVILAEGTRGGVRETWGTRRVGVQWLTTADVARMLEVTRQGVQWLARTGALPYEATTSGQRLFREHDMLRVVARRATARLVGRLPARPAPIGEPRQLSLFGKARLQLVGGERALSECQAKGSRSLNDRAGF